jgi:hypothetical protein
LIETILSFKVINLKWFMQRTLRLCAKNAKAILPVIFSSKPLRKHCGLCVKSTFKETFAKH